LFKLPNDWGQPLSVAPLAARLQDMPLLRCLRVCLLSAPALTACGPDWDALLHVQLSDAGSSALEPGSASSAAEPGPIGSEEPSGSEPSNSEPSSTAQLLPPESADDASLIGTFASDGGIPDSGSLEPLEQTPGNVAR
jgi:hypothetical protein